MLRAAKIWTLSVLLSSALLSGCGTTRASLPSPGPQIPVAERLRADCLGLPANAATMPAASDAQMAARYLAERDLGPVSNETLALLALFGRFMQGVERAYWGEREAIHARIEAQACLDRRELRGLIDAANAANATSATDE